jgi:hypothetical protein
MRTTLRDWDALFAEMSAQASGRTTRARATYVRTAARLRPRWQRAEQELDELGRATADDRLRRTPELERTLVELRELFTNARLE